MTIPLNIKHLIQTCNYCDYFLTTANTAAAVIAADSIERGKHAFLSYTPSEIPTMRLNTTTTATAVTLLWLSCITLSLAIPHGNGVVHKPLVEQQTPVQPPPPVRPSLLASFLGGVGVSRASTLPPPTVASPVSSPASIPDTTVAAAAEEEQENNEAALETMGPPAESLIMASPNEIEAVAVSDAAPSAPALIMTTNKHLGHTSNPLHPSSPSFKSHFGSDNEDSKNGNKGKFTSDGGRSAPPPPVTPSSFVRVSRPHLGDKLTGILDGSVDALAGTVKGLFGAVTHPRTTFHGVRHVVANPTRAVSHALRNVKHAFATDPYHATGATLTNGLLAFAPVHPGFKAGFGVGAAQEAADIAREIEGATEIVRPNSKANSEMDFAKGAAYFSGAAPDIPTLASSIADTGSYSATPLRTSATQAPSLRSSLIWASEVPSGTAGQGASSVFDDPSAPYQMVNDADAFMALLTSKEVRTIHNVQSTLKYYTDRANAIDQQISVAIKLLDRASTLEEKEEIAGSLQKMSVEQIRAQSVAESALNLEYQTIAKYRVKSAYRQAVQAKERPSVIDGLNAELKRANEILQSYKSAFEEARRRAAPPSAISTMYQTVAQRASYLSRKLVGGSGVAPSRTSNELKRLSVENGRFAVEGLEGKDLPHILSPQPEEKE